MYFNYSRGGIRKQGENGKIYRNKKENDEFSGKGEDGKKKKDITVGYRIKKAGTIVPAFCYYAFKGLVYRWFVNAKVCFLNY